MGPETAKGLACCRLALPGCLPARLKMLAQDSHMLGIGNRRRSEPLSVHVRATVGTLAVHGAVTGEGGNLFRPQSRLRSLDEVVAERVEGQLPESEFRSKATEAGIDPPAPGSPFAGCIGPGHQNGSAEHRKLARMRQVLQPDCTCAGKPVLLRVVRLGIPDMKPDCAIAENVKEDPLYVAEESDPVMRGRVGRRFFCKGPRSKDRRRRASRRS